MHLCNSNNKRQRGIQSEVTEGNGERHLGRAGGLEEEGEFI
jgi:hypothetical protein